MDGWKTSFLLGWPILRGELLVLGSVMGNFSHALLLFFSRLESGEKTPRGRPGSSPSSIHYVATSRLQGLPGGDCWVRKRDRIMMGRN